MKLLGSTESKITKDKKGENVPHLSITEVVLVHCIQLIMIISKFLVNNDYQQISPTNPIFLKTFNSEYDEIIVWFTDQNSQPLETEDRINLTMVVK